MEKMRKRSIIDLHSHILPRMDDGSESPDMSLQMLKALAAQGVTAVCATSHYYARHETVSEFCNRRETAWCKLQASIELGLPNLRLGAEVAYFPGISEYEELDRLCLDGTRTMLLELSFSEWTPRQVEEVASLSLDRRFHIILAHPERFARMGSYWEDMEQLLGLPIGLQINADSLVHWRGRKLALELLESTKHPMLGSDCHNLATRPPRLDRAREVVDRKLGRRFLERMDETAQEFTQIQEVHT